MRACRATASQQGRGFFFPHEHVDQFRIVDGNAGDLPMRMRGLSRVICGEAVMEPSAAERMPAFAPMVKAW
jgi:hypothetical protein